MNNISKQYRHSIKNQGFSLVEIIVVVSIISLISSIGLVNLSDAKIQTQYAQVEDELNLIAEALSIAGGGVQSIGAITGSWCSSYCACRNMGVGYDLRNISSASSCYTLWKSAIEDIASQSLLLDNVEALYRDPWGTPYLIDENELEYPGPTPPMCRRDRLLSVGADGVYNTSDDFVMLMPFRSVQCKSLN